jgi:hypothetical protein
MSPLHSIAVMLALGGLLVTTAKPDQNRQFDFTGVHDLSRHQWIVLVIVLVLLAIGSTIAGISNAGLLARLE